VHDLESSECLPRARCAGDEGNATTPFGATPLHEFNNRLDRIYEIDGTSR